MVFRGEWEGVEWEGGMPESLKETGFIPAPMKKGQLLLFIFLR